MQTGNAGSRGDVHRRTFLELGAATGAVLAIDALAPGLGAPAEAGKFRWRKGKVAKIKGTVVLDHDVEVAGVQIARGGALIFAPGKNVTLKSRGNVVVRGKLRMNPKSHRKSHKLVFPNVEEGRFKGGGMSVLGSDVGLWVMDRGSVDLDGSGKSPFALAKRALDSGETTFPVVAAPGMAGPTRGWQAGDEVVICPTLDLPALDGFEVRRIVRTTKDSVTVDAPLNSSHPGVTVKGKTYFAEIANLSRNCKIEGRPGGRAHIFIHSMKPQKIHNVGLRWLGPRQGGGVVLGRWPLHFHHHMHGDRIKNGKRIPTVLNTVARDSGSHAFVQHNTNRTTLSRCISYDNLESPYWWDKNSKAMPSSSSRTRWRDCWALRTHTGEETKFRNHAFLLARGNKNELVRCRVVGHEGLDESAAFAWEPAANRGAPWLAAHCVAHNIGRHPVWVWHNTKERDVIEDFVGYNYGGQGIRAGAYANGAVYKNCAMKGGSSPSGAHLDGAPCALALKAASMDGPVQAHNDFWCEGDVVIEGRNAQGHVPAVVRRLRQSGGGLVVACDNGRALYDFHDYQVNGRAIEMADIDVRVLSSDSELRFFDGSGNLRFSISG